MDPSDPYGPALHRWRVAYLVAGAAFLALFVAWTRQEWGGLVATRTFVDMASTLIPLAAGAGALARARYLPSERRLAWVFLGLAALSWGLGNVAWTYNELVLGEFPFPSLADIGYLGLIPLAAAGLLVMIVGSTAVTSRLRTVLDGLLVAGAVLFAGYAVLLRPLLEYASQQESTLAQAVAVTYPLGDLMLLALLLLVATRVAAPIRRTLAILAAALVLLTVGDIGFWYLTALGAYQTGSITDVGWVGCFVVLGYATLRPIPVLGDQKEADHGLALTALPLAPFFVALVTAVVVQLTEGGLPPFLFWNAAFVVAAIVARQSLMLIENVALRRTAQAARHEAEDALAKLKAAAEFRSRFVHTVTHDLRNPLTPILLQLAILDRQETPTGVRERLVVLRRNVQQVERLVMDLADVGKLQDGKLNLVLTPMDVADTLRDATATFAPGAADRRINLVLECMPLPTTADAIRIRQVVVNLVSNAVKFSPDAGSIFLRGLREGDRLRVEVQDGGRGLTPEEQARLFQPFSQVHDRKDTKERGSGLGLYISKGIVEQHGGHIGVRSQGKGHGSTFWFELPARTEALPGAPPSAMAPTAVPQVPDRLAAA